MVNKTSGFDTISCVGFQILVSVSVSVLMERMLRFIDASVPAFVIQKREKRVYTANLSVCPASKVLWDPFLKRCPLEWSTGVSGGDARQVYGSPRRAKKSSTSELSVEERPRTAVLSLPTDLSPRQRHREGQSSRRCPRPVLEEPLTVPGGGFRALLWVLLCPAFA